jgi:hypothetical protein
MSEGNIQDFMDRMKQPNAKYEFMSMLLAGSTSGMKISWQVIVYVRILGQMLTGFRLRRISLLRKEVIIYIQVFMVSQNRKV